MKAFSYTTLFFLILLTSSSCKKDDLPKATQTGANTMAAKIDGIDWKAQHCWSCVMGGKGLHTVYSPNEGKFNVLGQLRNDDTNISITIEISGIKDVGTYELGANTGTQSFSKVSDDKLGRKYYTTAPSSGSVTITKLNIPERIISGTFEFTASDLSSNKIKVTQGVFDLKF